MRIKILSKSVLLAVVFLVGCAHRTDEQIITDDQDVRKAEVQLASASQDINKSLQELAAIEKATHPAAKLPNQMDPDMIGMGQLISIDWNGPVGPLVNKIAEISSYKVKVLGTPPAIPIIVTLTAKNTPLADVLRDTNFQCEKRANIVIYPANRIIELRYARI